MDQEGRRFGAVKLEGVPVDRQLASKRVGEIERASAMNLCIDVGNSQLHGAVYENNKRLVMQIRKESSYRVSSDEMGLFLVSALREKGIDSKQIRRIGVSCVVPEELFTLKVACREYFNTELSSRNRELRRD